MRSSFVKLRLLAMVLMAFGFMASSGLSASAAPAAPAGAHAARYQSVDVAVCITLFNAGLLNPDGSVVDPLTFEAGANNAGVTDPTLILAIINGGCSGFPVPTPVGTGVPLPTLPPVETPTVAPTATEVVPTATEVVPTATEVVPTATATTAPVTPTVTPTPVTTPDPATEGTVNVSVFSCTNLMAPVFQAGAVIAAAEAIPSSDGTCTPDAGLFTFYFVGDGTNAFAQLAVNGSNSIGLPAGDYEVVEENTQLRVLITVTDGGVLSLVLSLPAVGDLTPTPSSEGTVNVSKFFCTGLTETVFQAAPVVNEVPVGIAAAAEAGIPSTAGECSPGAATITFYLVGDGTNAFAQLSVNGTGSIGLPAGDYEIVEEETQAHNFITVTEGGILTLVISNPAGSATPTPVVTPTTAPGVTPTVAPGVTPTATSATTSTKVNALPNTGQGSSGHTNDALILLLGAMSVLLAAGVALRHRRIR